MNDEDLKDTRIVFADELAEGMVVMKTCQASHEPGVYGMHHHTQMIYRMRITETEIIAIVDQEGIQEANSWPKNATVRVKF